MTAPSSPWEFPIDLRIYDFRPQLSDAERKALQIANDRLKSAQNPWCKATSRSLTRLVVPIRDVLATFGLREVDIRRTVNFMLKSMARLGTVYWVWSYDTWRDVFLSARDLNRSTLGRTNVLILAYVFGEIYNFREFGRVHHTVLAKHLFGEQMIDNAQEQIHVRLVQWGYSENDQQHLRDALCLLLLICGSPHIEQITNDALKLCYQQYAPKAIRRYVGLISRVLTDMGIVPPGLKLISSDRGLQTHPTDGVSPEWVSWCQRWKATTTISARGKQGYFYNLMLAGRWLATHHPDIIAPNAVDTRTCCRICSKCERVAIWRFRLRRSPNTYKETTCAIFSVKYPQVSKYFFAGLPRMGMDPYPFYPAALSQSTEFTRTSLTRSTELFPMISGRS